MPFFVSWQGNVLPLNHGDALLFRSQSKTHKTKNCSPKSTFFLFGLPYFLKNFLSSRSSLRLSPALCSGVVVVNMLFAVTSLSPNTPPSSSSSSSSSDDDDENDDEENKGKKKTKLTFIKKKNLSRISPINLMRRAQSLGDLLLTTTNNNKKKKKKKKKNEQISYQTLAIVILSSLLIFSLLVIKQQNKNRKIRDIDRKLHHTISALATRAQWSLEEVSNGEKTKWWKNYNHPQQHDSIQNLPLVLLDEYGLPTLQPVSYTHLTLPTKA